MDWNQLMWGVSTSECESDDSERTNIKSKRLFRRVARNSFVTVYLKASSTLSGYFIQEADDEVTLIQYSHFNHSVIKVCTKEIVAVKVTNKRKKQIQS
ncbi:hypothetical protein [Alkalihalobacillus trypoxylicola]|uniref:Uncharacterized protein n=1 Tax=Alkalihalobacillus trypoxylicola TaxID=519424 RepID=A0A162EER7_9BACI|nr:hypothetical protein [Alkalihalobacillus trypoxylicola]KYG32402.1 hypothetical protein AZF04_06475 [Alkalihalobacillus trypoxylicola]